MRYGEDEAKFGPQKSFEKRVPKKQANPIDIQVGNRVRIRRMLIGMSQEKLGDLLGLTFQQVQKYEKGVNRIGAGRLYEMARILNVPVDFFFMKASMARAGQPGSGEEGAPVMEFVSSGEGMQLSLAFMKIKDTKDVRKTGLGSRQESCGRRSRQGLERADSHGLRTSYPLRDAFSSNPDWPSRV